MLEFLNLLWQLFEMVEQIAYVEGLSFEKFAE